MRSCCVRIHSFCIVLVSKMVNRCVAGGCSNTPSPGISLYKFPKDPTLRRQWEKQVQRTRAKWKATENSFLCSEHFTEDCFEVTATLASQFGISRKRRLVPAAVPTIFSVPTKVDSSECSDKRVATPSSLRKRPAATIPASVSKRTRSAAEKRQRTRVRRFSMCFHINNIILLRIYVLVLYKIVQELLDAEVPSTSDCSVIRQDYCGGELAPAIDCDIAEMGIQVAASCRNAYIQAVPKTTDKGGCIQIVTS